MDRKIYIKNDIISLVEYLPDDDSMNYNDWQDITTQKGYNLKLTDSFLEYTKREIRPRFCSSVTLNENNSLVGWIGLSPEGTPPDLAIRIFKAYRSQGYGTAAFKLGIAYCFETLKLECIYAGCYPDNQISRKMLLKCGFTPHPEGDIHEKHFLTGEDITQYDYILINGGHES